jgi:dTDP-4-dehydrorhamnose reductase
LNHGSGLRVVIGAAGMLGTDLLARLKACGAPVLGLDLPDIDITRRDAVMACIKATRPSYVFNAAAMTDVDGCEDRAGAAFLVNAEAAESLALACAAYGALLVHLSTDYVFDGHVRVPYKEDDPCNPQGVYARSKARGEVLVREASPQAHLIVRTQWLFGLHGKNFVEAIIRQADRTKLLRVVADQFGRPTYSKDLAEALVVLVESGARGTFHVTNSGTATWLGFAQRILSRTGFSDVYVDALTTGELDRKAPRPLYSVLDGNKFAQFTGTGLRRWESALDDYLAERSCR